MPNALIFSPSFDGHRQIHVFVYAQILKELDFKVFIAGNLKEKILNSTYIDNIKREGEIEIIDTSPYSQNGFKITTCEFIELQNKYKTDLTVFAEADFHVEMLNGQILNKGKRLKGRNVGTFFRPFYFYQKKDFLDKIKHLKRLPSTWRTDDFLFHEILLRKFKLLDAALHIDENFVSHHSYTHWLPDVFQSYAEEIVGVGNNQERLWIDRLKNFKEANKGKFVFLYFGTAQKRRGYDVILKMASEEDACFIHCGLNHPDEKYDLNISDLKKNLEKEGRLLETNQYISDPVCIESFFKSATFLVLPYQNFWGSSGVMLQALGYGIPVLVPEDGIMGYRVRKHKLGLTYGSGSPLTAQVAKFKQLPAQTFSSSISEYMKYQTPELLKKVLLNVFNGSGQIVEHP